MDLLLTNRQISAETKDATVAAYPMNTFHFQSADILIGFGTLLPAKELASIRSLELDLTNMAENVEVLRAWFRVLSDILADDFPGLQSLYIYRSEGNIRYGALPPRVAPVSSLDVRRALERFRVEQFRQFDKRSPTEFSERCRTKRCRMSRVPKPEDTSLEPFTKSKWLTDRGSQHGLGRGIKSRWQIGSHETVLLRSNGIPTLNVESLFFKPWGEPGP